MRGAVATVGPLLLSAMLATGAASQTRALSGGEPPAVAQSQTGGSVWGRVVDARTGQPVVAVRVRVREIGRNELSHAEGTFHFDRLAAGRYTVVAERIGYAPAQQEVTVAERDTVHITLRMQPSAIELAGIVVTGMGRERSRDEVYRPTTVVDGAELRRRLGTSVAATLADEPGIAQRYNGPAASQPVVRGLSGDRVLMLEDGNRTGDLSSTAADHAVAIEPLTAERIEVLRGPAGVLYGSSALGGVINIIREEVPRTLPEALTGTFSTQAESVNRGLTGGGSVLGAAGHVALRGELSGRVGGDTRTPLGTLPSTALEGYNAGAGASWIGERGFAGAAVRDYRLVYGVPGTFNGRTIPGAHEGGVSIDVRRSALRSQTALRTGGGTLRSVELDGNLVRFEQHETEIDGAAGSSFLQWTGTAHLLARHEHQAGQLLSEGAFGAWTMVRDLDAFGTHTGTRPARQLTLAGFVFEELGWRALRLQLGARYDWSRVEPLDTRPGPFGTVRTRDFGAVSGSAAGVVEVVPGVSAGVSLARAFRTPSVEELFSDGPHLADFSYNIGNPDLDPEFGFGADAFVRVTRPGVHVEIAAYRNAIANYIFYEPTGRLDPRLGQFPVFRARGDDAVLRGFEARAQWELVERVVVQGSVSQVVGRRTGGDEPLPAIPPLSGGVGVRYDGPLALLHLGWSGAAAKRASDVAPNEAPTPGYGLLNAGAGLRWTGWGRLHTLTLEIENLADATWYDHLSRIRAVAPQPGRNAQLLYRINF